MPTDLHINSLFGNVEQLDAVNDAPDVANEDKFEDPLQQAENKGIAVELISNASTDHSAQASQARDAVEHEAHNGCCVLEHYV